jgi:hypothetical protein
MTKDSFIARVVDEITEGRSIPAAPNTKRIEQIMKEAVRFFHENSDEAVENEYIILDASFVDTPLFKSKRQIQLPSCVEAIEGLSETGSMMNAGGNNINADYRKTNFNQFMMTGGDSDAMLYSVVSSYYSDFLRNFVLTRVSYGYSSHTKMLTIKGRDHFRNLVALAAVHISAEALYESTRFFEYVCGKCKISFANIFGFTNAKLIGGVELSLRDIRDDGKEMVKDIKQQLIDDRDTLDYFDEF